MYFRTVRGETRIPNLTSNSLAMRSSPQSGFSVAIRRIRARSLQRYRRPTCPALPPPEDPPTQSVPANNGRRADDHYRIAPIEESGEHRKAHASRVIHSSGLDTPFEIPGELSAKHQVFRTNRTRSAKEQGSQLQDICEYPDNCSRQCQHAFIMPDSAHACSRATPPNQRRELLRSTMAVFLHDFGESLVNSHLLVVLWCTSAHARRRSSSFGLAIGLMEHLWVTYHVGRAQ